jgi:homoserine dehydrogenase
MSGTPVLAPLTERLGGVAPARARGVVNATVNQILTEMASGAGYDDALAKAQADGLAEPDPSADVDGRDECAKAMVLAALAFGVQLAPEDVEVRGISSLRADEEDALRGGGIVRSVTSLSRAASGGLSASVQPEVLADDDPLRGVDGVENRLLVETRDAETLSFRGPGAGPEIAGLGALNDLRAIAGE